LFSLGSVMYAMCTGHSPFRASGTHAVLMRVIEDTPRDIRENNPELPDWLNDIILKLLAKKPDERFQTAQEVAELLEQHLAHVQQPHVAPKPAPVVKPVSAKSEEASTPAGPTVPQQILDETDRSIRIVQNIALAAGVILIGAGVVFSIVNPHHWQTMTLLFIGGGMSMAAAGFLKQHWEVEHEGHTIALSNNAFESELFIDHVKVAKSSGMALRRELRGVIPGGRAAGSEIKAIVEAGRTELRCRIVVQAGKTTAANADKWTAEPEKPVPRPRFPWRRLAWMTVGYVVVCLVLTPFIAGYSDMGWWSTPWIEFIAAPVFLLLAIGQLFVRPMWLAVLPACLGLFVIALGLTLWPFSTARHFARLVREGRFEEANRMLASGPWDYRQGELDVSIMVNGPGVRLSREDFPLESWDNSLDHFLQQNDIDALRFTLQSRWVQDRYCELNITAFRGEVRCEGVNYRHHIPGRGSVVITAQEFAERKQAIGVPVDKMPETAAEVLPAMVGHWQVETTHKVINGAPVGLQTAGKAHIELVAGKRFLRIRAQAGPDDANFLTNYAQMFSFDPKTSDFRNTHFDASGAVMGPTTSRWDSRTHTLTGVSQPDASGTFIKNTRFIDANTLEWEAIVRDKNSKTIFDTYTKMTRIAGPAKINEEAMLAPPPAQMAVLHKFVGDWQTDGATKLPEPEPFKSRSTTTKILGGRMLEMREIVLPTQQENYVLMTYDVAQQCYRFWQFGASGYTNDFRGSWDAKNERLTWTWTEADMSKGVAVMQWRGPDRYEDHIQVTGNVVLDQQLTTTRQTGAGVAPAKMPEKADELLPAMVGNWQTEVTHKIVNGKPLNLGGKGGTVIDWVAGKFLRVRENTGVGGSNHVQVFSFDAQSKDFRNLHFDARGMILGPGTTSRWDQRTHTLTGTSAPAAEGLSVKNTRFVDADTMEWELIVRDKTGKTIFETYAKMTRTAGPVKIDESEAPVPVPKEMAPLHRFVGNWQVSGKLEAKAIALLKLPVYAAPLAKNTAAAIMGGRFVEIHETLSAVPKESNYALMTYDAFQRRYRMWTFAPGGYQNELRGSWDEKEQRLTWTWTEPDSGKSTPYDTAPGSGTMHLAWRNADKYETSVEVRNFNNVAIADANATVTRESSP